MRRQARGKADYRVWVEPELHAQRGHLPGNVRQRVKRALDNLAGDARPPDSRPLDRAGLGLPPEIEVRRLRLGKWRLIYAVNQNEGWVWVLALRQRPPYDYEDLPEMLAKLQN